jgi:lipopolysaccharide export system protein LptA
MNSIFKNFGMICLMSCVAGNAFAQMPGSDKKQPISIEASSQLEWIRDKNMYRATKDVVITQGDTVVKGDNAEAEYDPAIGQSALTIMTVTGHVIMTNQGRTLTSDKGVYDTRTKILTMTGDVTTLTTPAASVTSRNGMVYDSANGKAVATGHAVATEPDKKMTADVITAFIDTDTNKLQRAIATGHVIITHTTPDGVDVSQSQKATYDMGSDIINLDGDVKLTKGTNHMEGDAAVINLKTGISNLKNNSTQGGRVRAIFNTGDQSSPMQTMTGSMPMVKSKKNFEQPYAVDNNASGSGSGSTTTSIPRMPGQ